MLDTGHSMRETDILDYLRVIWKWAWLIALVFVLTTLAAFTVSSLMGKVYETETTFRIMGRQRGGTTALSQIPSSARAALGISGGGQDLQTYSQIMKSRRIIDKIIDDLPHLMDKYSVGQNRGIFGKLKGMMTPYDEEVREQMGEEEFRRRLLLKELSRSIKVQQPGGDVLSVRVKWSDPKSAADIADRLGAAFIKYDRTARQEAADRTLNFIQSALKGNLAAESPNLYRDIGESGIEHALAEAEQRLSDFKKQHKTVVMQEEARKLIEKFVDAEDALSSAIVARKTAVVRLADTQKQLSEQSETVVSAKTVTDNPIVQYLQREMAQLEIQAESLKVDFGEANPELKALRDQIAEYEKRIRREVPRIVSQETTSANPLYEYLRQGEINCLIDISVSKAKELSIRERIAALEKKLAQMPDEEMQLTNLTREVETYSRMYLTLRQSESEAQLVKESIVPNVSILDKPNIPLRPAAPKVMMNTAIASVIGLMLGLGLAFFLEYVRRAKGAKYTSREL